eukprot:13314644-Alexandrium_andersonii.AAC.1
MSESGVDALPRAERSAARKSFAQEFKSLPDVDKVRWKDQHRISVMGRRTDAAVRATRENQAASDAATAAPSLTPWGL